MICTSHDAKQSSFQGVFQPTAAGCVVAYSCQPSCPLTSTALTVTGVDASIGQPMVLADPSAVPTEKNALPFEGHVAEEMLSPSGAFMMRVRPAPFVSVLRWQQCRNLTDMWKRQLLQLTQSTTCHPAALAKAIA